MRFRDKLLAFLIATAARLRLSRLVVAFLSADKSQEAIDRNLNAFYWNAAFVYVVTIAAFIAAFFVQK
ncbi:MAG: hypothetical protein JST28_09050 [Acidobacteria bacterium]|nr:hypothetical protein [Acidobacteriota bacterium]